jgi:hypothetical protein
MLIGILIGVAAGWLIPQPTLTWDDGTRDGQKVGLLKWGWLWVRDKAGMN